MFLMPEMTARFRPRACEQFVPILFREQKAEAGCLTERGLVTLDRLPRVVWVIPQN